MKSILKQSGFAAPLIRLLVLLAISAALVTAYGCGKRGDAEKAGEKIDETMEEAQEEAGDMMDQDGPMEDAGEKADDAMDGDK